MTDANTKQLVTVAEYVKLRELSAPQIVNGWIRKQGAPCVEVDGKRMIDVEAMDAWVENKTQRKAEGHGTTKSDSVQRKTSVKKNSMMVHNSRKGVVVTRVRKISEFLVWGETSRGRGMDGTLPIQWDMLDEKVKKKELVPVNPDLILELLYKHFNELSVNETGELSPEQLTVLEQIKDYIDHAATLLAYMNSEDIAVK